MSLSLTAGVWKAMAATLNLFGLALTSASHGAFLIQLTTLIVPLVQGERTQYSAWTYGR
jgi:hypothetical protein